MTTGDLIDAILSYTDNVDPADADNNLRRPRILFYTQEIFDYVWRYRPWTWKMRTTTTINVDPTLGTADLPADFANLGYNSKVYDNITGRELWEQDYFQLQEKKRLGIQSGYPPEAFAIGGFNTTTNRKVLNTLSPGVAITLTCDYEAAPPTLLDNKTSPNLLEQLPANHHHSVLLPGVHSRTAKTTGDMRDWDSIFKAGLVQMLADERPLKGQIKQMPRHSVGVW